MPDGHMYFTPSFQPIYSSFNSFHCLLPQNMASDTPSNGNGMPRQCKTPKRYLDNGDQLVTKQHKTTTSTVRMPTATQSSTSSTSSTRLRNTKNVLISTERT